MRYVFLSLLILVLTACQEKGNHESGKTENSTESDVLKKPFGLITVNNLRMRGLNDIHSQTLRHLDKGMIVEIIEKDPLRSRVNEFEDYWYKVRYDGVTGWIFGYYMEINQDYESAYVSSKRFTDNKNKLEISIEYDPAINDKLYFISDSHLMKVKNVAEKVYSRINIKDEISVLQVEFPIDNSKIYILGNEKSGEKSIYEFTEKIGETKKIARNVTKFMYDEIENEIIYLTQNKNMNKNIWTIKQYDCISAKTKTLTTITTDNSTYKTELDPFANTLSREKGGLIYLEKETERNFIYFKPPESNSTYLVSMVDGSNIKIETRMKNKYKIDNSRYLDIATNPSNIENKTLYTLKVKDTNTGYQKEIFTSELYPINFTISKDGRNAAVTMTDMHNTENDTINKTDIYILSLIYYNFYRITDDGVSYQPTWTAQQ